MAGALQHPLIAAVLFLFLFSCRIFGGENAPRAFWHSWIAVALLLSLFYRIFFGWVQHLLTVTLLLSFSSCRTSQGAGWLWAHQHPLVAVTSLLFLLSLRISFRGALYHHLTHFSLLMQDFGEGRTAQGSLALLDCHCLPLFSLLPQDFMGGPLSTPHCHCLTPFSHPTAFLRTSSNACRPTALCCRTRCSSCTVPAASASWLTALWRASAPSAATRKRAAISATNVANSSMPWS